MTTSHSVCISRLLCPSWIALLLAVGVSQKLLNIEASPPSHNPGELFVGYFERAGIRSFGKIMQPSFGYWEYNDLWNSSLLLVLQDLSLRCRLQVSCCWPPQMNLGLELWIGGEHGGWIRMQWNKFKCAMADDSSSSRFIKQPVQILNVRLK